MKFKDIGEYETVKHITGWLSKNVKNSSGQAKSVIVPAGDDAAVIRLNGYYIVCTKDLLIQDVHFKLSWAKTLGSIDKLLEALGYKSLAINMSDLSAMGASPGTTYCLVGLGIPSDLSLHNLNHFYKGMQGFAKISGIQFVGGDTNSSDKIVISITLIGQIDKSCIIRRNGAKPNDNIYVTGFLGDSSAGLSILENRSKGLVHNRKLKKHLLHKHLYPPFKLKDIYGFRKDISAMLDCSDGLVNSIEILCQSGNTGADIFIDNIPISKQLSEFCRLKRQSPLDFALYGGEDYELVFTSQKILKEFKCIGKIMKKSSGVAYFKNGKKYKIDETKKFQHFKK